MATKPRLLRKDYNTLRERLLARFPNNESVARRIAHLQNLQQRRARATEKMDILTLDQQIKATRRGLREYFHSLQEQKKRAAQKK